MRGLMRRVLLGLTNLACRAWLDQPGLTALALVFSSRHRIYPLIYLPHPFIVPRLNRRMTARRTPSAC